MKKSYSKKIIFISVIALITTFMLIWKLNKDTCEKVDNSLCRIRINGKTLNLKVAYSDAALQRGLMWVGHLKEDEGMIFVYDEPVFASFWMKNTIIPLSIAFVMEDGRISTIQDMYPQPGKPEDELYIYNSIERVRFAIETNLGWFSNRGIKPGDYVKIPEVLKN